jgi:two-component system, response regulator PdtaR
MIKEAGFDVLVVANADDAIVLLETRLDIERLFTDIDMPGSMNGIKLAHAVRIRLPPIKIIVTSGHVTVCDGICRPMFGFCRNTPRQVAEAFQM